jgi:rod shape determining protein RodA
MISMRAAFGIAGGRVGTSRWRRFVARFDWVLFVTILVVAAIGLANLYSATHRTPHSVKFESQMVWMAIGLVLFLAVSNIDYHVWHRLAWPALAMSVVAIVAVRFVGDGEGNGAQRWLHVVPGLRFQPSELAKIAIILAVGRLIHDGHTGSRKLIEGALPVLGMLAAIGLIAVQPDLGTASVIALIVGSVCLLLARNLIPIAAAAAAGLAMLPLLWDHMHGYQKARVLAFLDPAADPTGTGWHTQQSIFAVGSGRLTGKGYLEATQNHFNFLPEYWTDFPFSVWAEEWGFIGSVAMLAVFVFLILWVVNLASNARDPFGTAICVGVGAMLFWHVVINIAMVLGLAPVVGITLPLVSYGGSSVVTIFLGLGLVSSVSMRRT